MHIVLFIIILFYAACSLEPEQPITTTQEDTNLDTIVYHGHFLKSYNDVALYGLFHKLDAQQGLKIRIFGDSHIAEDSFAAELRSLLFDDNVLPGFLYPLQPKYHHNATARYSAKYFRISNSLRVRDRNEDYPLGGVIASANRANATLQLSLQTYQKTALNSTIVFRSPNNKAAFRLTDASGKTYTLKAPSAKKWSFFTRKLHYPIRFQALQKNAALGGYFITHARTDNIIDTIGINGATANLWQHWNPSLLQREMYEIIDDLVILSYGTNDILADKPIEQIANDLRALISFVRTFSPHAAIMLLTPPTITQKGSTQPIEKLSELQDMFLRLAQQEKLLLFNTHEFMENNGGKEIWILKNLSQRDVHLTSLGYRFIARKIFQEMTILMQN